MCMFFVWMLVCYVDVLCVDSGWLNEYFVRGYWIDMQLFLDDTRWMRLFFVDIDGYMTSSCTAQSGLGLIRWLFEHDIG